MEKTQSESQKNIKSDNISQPEPKFVTFADKMRSIISPEKRKMAEQFGIPLDPILNWMDEVDKNFLVQAKNNNAILTSLKDIGGSLKSLAPLVPLAERVNSQSNQAQQPQQNTQNQPQQPPQFVNPANIFALADKYLGGGDQPEGYAKLGKLFVDKILNDSIDRIINPTPSIFEKLGYLAVEGVARKAGIDLIGDTKTQTKK